MKKVKEIKELPGKFKSVKELSELDEDEDSDLEESIEAEEAQDFQEFVSSGVPRTPVLSSGQTSSEIPRAQRASSVPAPPRVQNTQESIYGTVYESAEAQSGGRSRSVGAPVFKAESMGQGRQPQKFAADELSALRNQREEKKYSEASLDDKKEDDKHKMTWERR